MNWWQAAFLGLIQGITEFLPVSSSGHLVLFSELLGVTDGSILFEVMVHLATLGAIIAFFNTDLFRLSRREILAVGIGTIPAVVVGLGFEDAISGLFSAVWLVSVALIITGVFNLLTDRRLEKDVAVHPLDDISYLHSFVIGLFQAMAIMPGISRSGSTVFSGLHAGLNREAAFRFSFLLAIPAIGGAGLLQAIDVWQLGFSSNGISVSNLIIGGVAAFISGWFSLKIFKYILTSAKMEVFGWYCLVVGSLSLVLQFV